MHIVQLTDCIKHIKKREKKNKIKQNNRKINFEIVINKHYLQTKKQRIQFNSIQYFTENVIIAITDNPSHTTIVETAVKWWLNCMATVDGISAKREFQFFFFFCIVHTICESTQNS